MTVHTRVSDILKSYGLDNENATQEILSLMQEPHGLKPQKVDELLEIDRDTEHNGKFDTLYPLSTILGAVEYGLDYGLKSQHQGFVPKGNVLQWLANLSFVDGLKPLKFKLDIEDATFVKSSLETVLATQSMTQDESNRIEILLNSINTYLKENK